jgi:hypothetical protein
MTPKEKAKELIEQFEGELVIPPTYGTPKGMAFICVSEILKNFEGLYKPEYCAFDAIGERKFTFKGEYTTHLTGYDMVKYWNQVISEIKKL